MPLPFLKAKRVGATGRSQRVPPRNWSSDVHGDFTAHVATKTRAEVYEWVKTWTIEFQEARNDRHGAPNQAIAHGSPLRRGRGFHRQSGTRPRTLFQNMPVIMRPVTRALLMSAKNGNSTRKLGRMKAVSSKVRITHTLITKMSELDPKGTERSFRYFVSHVVGSDNVVSVGDLGDVADSCEGLRTVVRTTTEDARARVIFHAIAPCADVEAAGGTDDTDEGMDVDEAIVRRVDDGDTTGDEEFDSWDS